MTLELLVFGVLSLLCVGGLAWPLRGRSAAAEVRPELAVYRDQLAELERDRARGVIGTEEAAAARREIERRLVRSAQVTGPALAVTRGGRVLLGFSLLLVPALAALTYVKLGSPGLPDQPLAARPAPPAEGPDIAALVARLEQRLAADPSALEGWLLLARSKAALGDPVAGVAAARRGLALDPSSSPARTTLAELLIQASGGTVPPEARDLLEQVHAADPGEPRAAFFLGLAAAQAGEPEVALATWRGLLAEAPADAPWRAGVVAAIREAAAGTGLEVEAMLAATPGRPAAAAAAPSPEARERARAIAALPPEERAAAIRSMVEGLEARLSADGGDVEGWLRLANARRVLGEVEKARAAFERALALRPDDPALVSDYAGLLLGPAEPGDGLPSVGADAKAAYERLALLAPDDPEPWWYLGIAAAREGRREEARRHWQRVLSLLPAGHPDRPTVADRLAALGS
jgi:cytochrome c-type biogenesis protein CcmH